MCLIRMIGNYICGHFSFSRAQTPVAGKPPVGILLGLGIHLGSAEYPVYGAAADLKLLRNGRWSHPCGLQCQNLL